MHRLICFTLSTLALAELIGKGRAQDFGYEGSEGPGYWGQEYQQCIGKHQSPINIDDHNVIETDMLPIAYENFDEEVSVAAENNGHTVEFSFNTTAVISGGPLVGIYAFHKLHFHWGSNDNEGSETLINNNSFPLEMHLVFFSASYGTIKEAIDHPDGLCVLSFMYSVTRGRELAASYSEMIHALDSVKEVHSVAKVANPLSLESILPRDRSTYYTYGGSLTTPPCSEVVTWIEYNSTIPIHHNQMEAFRKLKSHHGLLMHNFRPPQELHGRVIRTNKDILCLDEEPRSSTRNPDNFSLLVLSIMGFLLRTLNQCSL